MFKKLWERYVVWRYVEAGLAMGDYHGYLFCPDSVERKYEKWKERYKALGYEPLLFQDWVEAGGYGVPYKHLLRQPARGRG